MARDNQGGEIFRNAPVSQTIAPENVLVRAYCRNDPFGNLLNTIYPTLTPQFRYDSVNRLTNMVEAVGATTYTYDSAGAILSEDGPWASDTITCYELF
jgi:YD repeat-containing protein